MSVLTESELRMNLKGENLETLKEYRIKQGTVVTPSAREYLSTNKIALVYAENTEDKSVSQEPIPKESALPKRYETVTGSYYDSKPEHMTAIKGTKLVNKDHPIIHLRGKIDSLEARILEVQVAFWKIGMKKAAEDLGKVLAFVHEVLRSEVLDFTLDDSPILDMSCDEIRARSHNPKKYYGIGHLTLSLEHGECVIYLNTLRTLVREVELVAYDTFKDEYGVPRRPDIIRAFNRLSSLFYVMMYKVLTKEYDK